MSLSRFQLERADLITTIEQGRRVEQEQFQENTRGMRTMGELLKARLFGSTQWAIDLRRRMTNYVQGGGEVKGVPRLASPPPEPHKFPCQDPYCDRCNEAIKRLFRDIGLLPSGKPDRLDLTDEPFAGRFRVPTRYRKDESDK
jgi:hypothetical protein